jgi:outer membrane protein
MMTFTTRFAFVAALASLTLGSAAVAQAPLKIAYINSQKIMAEAPGRSEAEATYDKEMTAVRAQLQKMDDSLSALVDAYRKEAPSMDSAARAAREGTLQGIEDDLRQQAQQLNQQMQQRQVELARPLLEQVSKVLDQIREEGHYAMIFDVGSQASVVVSADKTLEITDQVLARLKQLGPPKPLPPSAVPMPSGGPTPKPAGIHPPRG